MFSSNFIALASLLSLLVFQVDAGSLIPKAITRGYTIISSDKFEIQTPATPSRISPIGTSAQTSIAPFNPTAPNLIVNTTVPQGTQAELGWIFDGIPNSGVVFDGFAKNITVYFTAPGQDEEFIFSFSNEPSPDDPRFDFCGYFPGLWLYVPIDSDVLGTYKGRWVVKFGQSTQPDAPVSEHGCGPLPFDNTGVEFERSWEVVAAEA
ncbi:hypothetical protein C8J57DRAFT_1556100 [Mycena rebaudengoi]|nr:hypothetical protein C8J57DRAFT_1556100 [Mycena rebaudengoi]